LGVTVNDEEGAPGRRKTPVRPELRVDSNAVALSQAVGEVD
jgi:hypothetical protein